VGAGIVLLAARTFRGGVWGFGLRTDRIGRDIWWAVVGNLAFVPVCLGLTELATHLLEWLWSGWSPPEHPIALLLRDKAVSWPWRLVLLGTAALVAPIFEEMLFRGLFQSWLRAATGWGWTAVFVSAAGFSLVHAPQWQNVPALMVLGLILGYAYEKTGSLTLAILLHTVFNIRAVLLIEMGL